MNLAKEALTSYIAKVSDYHRKPNRPRKGFNFALVLEPSAS